ncbi:fumarylacetoacetate hydrolase family protein [Deinococcus sp.]|uniref:fumarylacetoacetate hydrolase family protein n=1 Tax=Deinococcus sp. TaxID=47478 RepID=UPI003C7CC416
MKLLTLRGRAAVLNTQGQAVLLQDLGFAGDLLALIRAGPRALHDLQTKLDGGPPGQTFGPGDLNAPLQRPPKIVAIGLNYRAHAAEAGAALPGSPLVFTKFPSALTGPASPVLSHHHLTSQLDYEVELAVVMGRRARHVSADRALEYVFGYTVANDLSARDLQFADGQWVRAKSLDTSCPLGPSIVTADELPDPGTLRLGCSVNGLTVQDDTTANLIFSVPELIAQLSASFTLEPGDLILTGTPEGVGFGRTPPLYLKAGDQVRCWVGGIGELNNAVVDELDGTEPDGSNSLDGAHLDSMEVSA